MSVQDAFVPVLLRELNIPLMQKEELRGRSPELFFIFH